MDIFIFAGQSNMCSRGKAETCESAKLKSNTQILTLDKNMKWDDLADGCVVYSYENFPEMVTLDNHDKLGLGPGLSFATHLSQKSGSRPIALVQTAVGGTAIKSWHPETGKCFKTAIERAKFALESKPGSIIKAILWHQGECDSDEENSKHYAGRLKAVLSAFRKELDNESLPIIVGTLGEYMEKHFSPQFHKCKVVNKAIRKVASETEHCALVEGADLENCGDDLHFSAKSAQELGRRYCEAWLDMQYEMIPPKSQQTQQNFAKQDSNNAKVQVPSKNNDYSSQQQSKPPADNQQSSSDKNTGVVDNERNVEKGGSFSGTSPQKIEGKGNLGSLVRNNKVFMFGVAAAFGMYFMKNRGA